MKFWTNKEDAMLREMCRSREPLEKLMHMIPGRAIHACQQRMRRLGLEKARFDGEYRKETILALLKERPVTSVEIAKRLGLSVQAVRPFVLELHSDHSVHISDRIQTGERARALLWSIGPGFDAEPMAARTRAKEPKEPKVRSIEEPVQTVIQIRIDPLTAAFYGRRVA